MRKEVIIDRAWWAAHTHGGCGHAFTIFPLEISVHARDPRTDPRTMRRPRARGRCSVLCAHACVPIERSPPITFSRCPSTISSVLSSAVSILGSYIRRCTLRSSLQVSKEKRREKNCVAFQATRPLGLRGSAQKSALISHSSKAASSLRNGARYLTGSATDRRRIDSFSHTERCEARPVFSV